MATGNDKALLVHLASGIGNIVQATPLLIALSRHGYTLDVLIDGDYAETADLFQGWSALRTVFNGAVGARPSAPYLKLIAAMPPFYWPRYRQRYAYRGDCVARPPDPLFYQDEQAYYLAFAKTLGCPVQDPLYPFLPIPASQTLGINERTLVLAPGCKTGEMAAKRWPYFAELAEAFEDVVVVGSEDDLRQFDGKPIIFPRHVRCLAGALSLRETAEAIAAAGVVVANDSGLGHVAGATGTPTILLFGPTPDRTLGRLPPNVQILRTGLACEPCWFTARLTACAGGVDCLRQLSVAAVAAAAKEVLGGFDATRAFPG